MFLVVIVVFLVTVKADPITESKCPQVKSVDNFDFSQFGTGQLFELARYLEDFVEKTGDCAIGNYEPQGDTTKFEISSVENKRRFVVKGLVRYDNDTQKIIYSFYEKGILIFVAKLDVIYTDNKNFFIMYNCNDAIKTKNEVFWILARTPEPEGDMQAQIDNFLQNNTYLHIKNMKWSSYSPESCEVKSK